MRCYALLGSWQAAALSWSELSVKHIQLDTMMLFALQPAMRALALEEAAVLCHDVESFHSDYAGRDVRIFFPPVLVFAILSCFGSPIFVFDAPQAGDYLAAAFRNGSFSQVIEFITLTSRLSRSHTRAACAVEHLLLDAVRHPAKALPKRPEPLPAALSRNYDVPELRWNTQTVSAQWEAAATVGPVTAGASEAALQLRHALLNALAETQTATAAPASLDAFVQAMERALSAGSLDAHSASLVSIVKAAAAVAAAAKPVGPADDTSVKSASVAAVKVVEDAVNAASAAAQSVLASVAGALGTSSLTAGGAATLAAALELLGLTAAFICPVVAWVPKKAGKKKGVAEDDGFV